MALVPYGRPKPPLLGITSFFSSVLVSVFVLVFSLFFCRTTYAAPELPTTTLDMFITEL
jgi:hypothetical protein